MKILYALLLILLAHVHVSAQGNVQENENLQFRLRQDVPVTIAGKQLSDPWSGGLNTPQFSTIDLNTDGQEDLFIFDRQLKKVYTWLAVQQSGQWKYKYAPEYEIFFPADLENWALLRDYNCDGLKDIFTSTPLGIRVFKQESAANGRLKFTLSESALYYNSNRVNMQMTGADVPAIADVDGDGDLDVLIAEFSVGKTLELYRNQQVELGLACGTMQYVQQTNWWGRISECDGCNSFLFSAYCRVAGPMHSGHSGSSLLLLDVDADGDKDLVMGAVQCDNLVLMENEGNTGNALMTSFTPTFPAAKPASFAKFPAAFYEDVTFDGVPDMLVSPQVTDDIWNMDFQTSTWLYRNSGAADKPTFNFVKNDFLQGQMIDIGEGAFPAFADLDGDGDLDMLVGNHASYSGNLYSASISFYRNTGTASAPAFELVTNDYLNLKNQQLYALKPGFADINRDNLPDLILTYKELKAGTNRISYILNKGTSGQAAYNFPDVRVLQSIPDGANPALEDVDNDGDVDLLVGMKDGSLAFYRNTGAAANPAYTLENNSFGGIGFNSARRTLYPSIADIDGDGSRDLITVDDSGVIRIYRDFTKNLAGTLTAEAPLLENELTQEVQESRLGKGLSIHVTLLGGENKLYLVIGTQGGGMYLLQQTAGNMAVNNPDVGLKLEVYPNPTDKTQRDAVVVRATEPVVLQVFDAIGRKVYQGNSVYSRSHMLPLRNFKAGMYIIRATSKTGGHTSAKLVIQ
ncbi:T9SS type A sorting domain-containing protein [Pontibacter cellulosilyticus]|uniref:T9SS type A sorting domain-containing protein n=1 Tax=Pontibacter cellulosilyticus TaxID=1720253 RepID=A0A923SIE3_9BACT|nr:T9SS type A sorting domain-containing protein [Pontibacter cellulosilyticus]MBC5992724.1 T9SS type A sorting domain-containing protein [Pontibacter cellulosilyticus]